MRVLFWGTPEFAAPSLRALLGEGYDVVGVITQPDRPQGRHHSTPVAPPVKQIALDEGIPCLQPEKPRGEDFMNALREFEADVSVVVAYGHILRQEVIDLPATGTFNVHASLLPRWRGAGPIQAALLAGDAETGVSIIRLVQKMDAGPVVLRAPTPILEDETYGELQLRLSELGALAIVEALALVSLGSAEEEPQDESLATYARQIEREDTRLDWTQSATEASRRIRAFDPRPGAFTTHRDADVKLFGARVVSSARGDPGVVLGVDESGMLVGCADGAVRIGYAQPAGRKRLAVTDWAQGRGVAIGDRFGA
jgi:methionyl-tRNA formyltransferase